MEMAWYVRTRSTCPRLHVGAVIVKDKRIVSTGYNGSQPGAEHCDDVGCDMVGSSCVRTIHAEVNAISESIRRQRAGSTIYLTHSPCSDCLNQIVHSGLIEVVYDQEFRDLSMDHLQTCADNGIVLRPYSIKDRVIAL